MFTFSGAAMLSFVWLSALFLLTLTLLLGVKEERHVWVGNYLLMTLTAYWVYSLVFHEAVLIQLGASLSLAVSVAVKIITRRRRALSKG